MSVACVTGGGGFVGGKLCRYLLNEGGYLKVVALDVYFSDEEEKEPLPGLKKIKVTLWRVFSRFNI